MKKSLEVLKDSDGITIKKLSYRKLFFCYQVPVYLGENNDPCDYIKLKVRYFQDKGEDGNHFCMIWPGKFITFLSQKWKIKVRMIHTDEDFSRIFKLDIPFSEGINEIIINGFIVNFRIIDKSWIRDYNLKKIFENE